MRQLIKNVAHSTVVAAVHTVICENLSQKLKMNYEKGARKMAQIYDEFMIDAGSGSECLSKFVPRASVIYHSIQFTFDLSCTPGCIH